MAKFTNTAAGPRGINLVGGETAWIEPGQTLDLDEKTIADGGAHSDIEKGEAAAKKAEAAETAKADAAAADA